MTVLRTDRKHASNCMTEENGVEKVKKRKNFFRSLRFRILIILIILGIVPGVIVTYTMLHNYQNRAVAMLTETVGDQCDILCNLIIRENYLNDTDSEVVNSKLELFSNVYNGRILLADRDFKIVSDTFHTEEGKTLLSSLAVACLKGEETSNYDARSKVLELAVPVQSPDVQQLQGVMLVSVSAVDIAETLAEMEQRGVMLIGSIVVLSVFLAWLLSTILVKPLARVTKAIEDLTDGMLDEEISVPDYTETELWEKFNGHVNTISDSQIDENGNLVDEEGNLIDWDGNRIDENGYLLNSDGSYQINANGEYIKSANLDGISDSYTGSAGETLPEAVSDTNVPGPPEDNTDPIEDNNMESEGLTNEEAGLD